MEEQKAIIRDKYEILSNGHLLDLYPCAPHFTQIIYPSKFGHSLAIEKAILLIEDKG